MRTFAEARFLARREARQSATPDLDIEIVDQSTREFDAGWVFYYQSADYIRTGDLMQGLVGNAPIFVARDSDVPVTSISYHRPVEESIAAYRSGGNPNGKALPSVLINGYTLIPSTERAIKVIREHSNLGLGAAKRAIDECLAGQRTTVNAHSVEAARALVVALAESGVTAEVEYDG